MSEITTNSVLPSAADNMGEKVLQSGPGKNRVFSTISAEALSYKSGRTKRARRPSLQSSKHRCHSRNVEPIPSLAAVAVAGFAAGYLCALLRA